MFNRHVLNLVFVRVPLDRERSVDGRMLKRND